MGPLSWRRVLEESISERKRINVAVSFLKVNINIIIVILITVPKIARARTVRLEDLLIG